MRMFRTAAIFTLGTLATVGFAQSTQGEGDRRGANGGADRGSVGTTPERQVRRDNTTTRRHTRVYGPVNQGGRQYDGNSNGLQAGGRNNDGARRGNLRRNSDAGRNNGLLGGNGVQPGGNGLRVGGKDTQRGGSRQTQDGGQRPRQ